MNEAQISCLDTAFPKDRLQAEFEIIWDIYPKRTAKVDGLEAYSARRKEGVRFRVLLEHTRAYKEARRGEDAKFTMNPATFFGPKHRYAEHNGKSNGQSERGDGQWARPMNRDLQAQAEREEEASRQQTQEEPTTDPDPTTKSVEERLEDL